jgi:hypothetical protein
MTPFPERPTDGSGTQDDIAELQQAERLEDDVLGKLDSEKLSQLSRQGLEDQLDQLRQGEGSLVDEATEDGIRRALQRTDLTPEDRQQFEQALQRLKQSG